MLFSLLRDPSLTSNPLLLILTFLAILIAVLTALSFHEFSHALVANWLGDPTAERMGRLTLNPLAHLDPVGFIMLLVAGFGYAKPVPYDPRYLRSPRSGSVLIGIAGPISNILFASVFALVLKLIGPSLGINNLLTMFCSFGAMINVNLAIFNLIPIPPLDGSKLLNAILADSKWLHLRMTIEKQGPFLLLILIMLDIFGGIGIFSRIFETADVTFFHFFGLV